MLMQCKEKSADISLSDFLTLKQLSIWVYASKPGIVSSVLIAPTLQTFCVEYVCYMYTNAVNPQICRTHESDWEYRTTEMHQD